MPEQHLHGAQVPGAAIGAGGEAVPKCVHRPVVGQRVGDELPRRIGYIAEYRQRRKARVAKMMTSPRPSSAAQNCEPRAPCTASDQRVSDEGSQNYAPGRVARAVELEMDGLGVAESRPGLVAAAVSMAAILDNPLAVA